MLTYRQLCTAFIAYLISALSLAHAALPSHIEVEFSLSVAGKQMATIQETFTHTQHTYQINSTTTPIGLFALLKPGTLQANSQGNITQHGLQPLLFSATHSVKTKQNVEIDFDWKNENAEFNNRHGSQKIALPQLTQDRLSVLYQFAFLSLPTKNNAIQLYVSSDKNIQLREYLTGSIETIKTPAGEFKALYLATPAEDTPRKTEIWLALEHHNFPCQIKITEKDGIQYTQTLTKLSIKP